jgi:hypothetical protein
VVAVPIGALDAEALEAGPAVPTQPASAKSANAMRTATLDNLERGSEVTVMCSP